MTQSDNTGVLIMRPAQLRLNHQLPHTVFGRHLGKVAKRTISPPDTPLPPLSQPRGVETFLRIVSESYGCKLALS